MTKSIRKHFDVAHLGAFEILTPKPDESLWFFEQIYGMEVVHREGQSVYMRGFADYANNTLKLTEAAHPGVGTIYWRTTTADALQRRATALEAAGLGDGWSEGDFGRGQMYMARDPDGHRLAFFFEEDKYEAPEELRSALMNQPMKFTGRGACVRGIDHLALLCKDPTANTEFAKEHLGVQLREQVIYENGELTIGSWMSTNAIHHQVAYVIDVKGMHNRVHHFSFRAESATQVLRAADILSENGIFIEAGPAKHNNSQAFYLYAYEPGGNRVECFASSWFINAPDWDVVVWDERTRGTGVYWGGALPDSFLEYATPVVEQNREPEMEDLAPFPIQ